MAPSQTELLQGTLDRLILKFLALGEMHGLGVSRAHRAGYARHFSGEARPAFSRAAQVGGGRLAWFFVGRIRK